MASIKRTTRSQTVGLAAEGEAMPLSEKALRARRSKYTLDDLIVGYNADAPLTDGERVWMDVAPAGREVL